MKILLAAGLLILPLCACQSRGAHVHHASGLGLSQAVRAELDLPVAEPPYTSLNANWKERLEERYVFVELVGSYTETARALGGLFQMLSAQGIEPAGVPFALFYDDPGHTPVSKLRSRACVPIPRDAQIAAPTGVDTLPSTLVVYAYIGGPYSDLPRAYPGLYAFMKKLGWAEAGPIRESYIVSPSSVSDWSELVAEVQIPAQPTR